MKHLISITVIILLVTIPITGCGKNEKTNSTEKEPIPTLSKSQMEAEAWQMEELYWKYVQNMDTVAYKTLWHEDFIGYPSFGNGVSNKSKIASWIPDLHKDPDLKFSYILHKKATNAIGDVVIVFYDTDEIWTDKQEEIVKKETFKFTHTWKKIGGQWVILGGMAANKN